MEYIKCRILFELWNIEGGTPLWLPSLASLFLQADRPAQKIKFTEREREREKKKRNIYTGLRKMSAPDLAKFTSALVATDCHFYRE